MFGTKIRPNGDESSRDDTSIITYKDEAGFNKSTRVLQKRRVVPNSRPDMLAQKTRFHTNHVVRSSPSATTATSDTSPAARVFEMSSVTESRLFEAERHSGSVIAMHSALPPGLTPSSLHS